MNKECLICGEVIENDIDMLRIHLESHDPNAEQFSSNKVLDYFIDEDNIN